MFYLYFNENTNEASLTCLSTDTKLLEVGSQKLKSIDGILPVFSDSIN